MAVVPGSSDVFAQQKLADEKCTRTYIFHHNIVSKSKETVQKLKFFDSACCTESIFPKNTFAVSPMDESPSEVDEKQLAELHLSIWE